MTDLTLFTEEGCLKPETSRSMQTDIKTLRFWREPLSSDCILLSMLHIIDSSIINARLGQIAEPQASMDILI